MFKVGTRYQVITNELTEEGYERCSQSGTVTKVAMPLVEFNGHWIVNTSSPNFAEAIDIEGRKSQFEDIRIQIMDGPDS